MGTDPHHCKGYVTLDQSLSLSELLGNNHYVPGTV